MELELRSTQEEAQRQERSIQNVTDAANSKETEVDRRCQKARETESDRLRHGKKRLNTAVSKEGTR